MSIRAHHEEEVQAKSCRARNLAFGAGSDARLYGLPLIANPYPADDAWLHESWREGWRHVDRCWGLDTRREVMRLPQVVAG